MELRLINTEMLRNRLITKQRANVKSMYDNAASKVNVSTAELMSRYGADEFLNVGDFAKVEKTAKAVYDDIALKMQNGIQTDMVNISTSAFNEFSDWLISYGLPDGSYSQNIPKSVVRSILNGAVYDKPDNLGLKEFNWGLSKSIWGDNQKTLSDIHRIISEGVAKGHGSKEIAQAIERYVGSTGGKKFDWGKVYPGSKTKIDYNASRLARTLLNHAFQQSFKESGAKNPWINYYIWHSAFAHGRTCQVCMDLDGQKFAKEDDNSGKYPELPLDHPNGLCYWTYEIDSSSMVDDLAKWVNGEPNGDMNSKIDEYYEYLRTR